MTSTESVKVLLRKFNLDVENETGSKTSLVTSIKIHPDWDSNATILTLIYRYWFWEKILNPPILSNQFVFLNILTTISSEREQWLVGGIVRILVQIYMPQFHPNSLLQRLKHHAVIPNIPYSLNIPQFKPRVLRDNEKIF